MEPARLREGSKAAGISQRETEAALGDVEALIMGIAQREVRIIAANPTPKVRGYHSDGRGSYRLPDESLLLSAAIQQIGTTNEFRRT